MVRVGDDRGMHTWRLREIRRDISPSQDSKERDGSKHNSNPDLSVTPAPEMPHKRHLSHPTYIDDCMTILVTQFFCYLRSSIFR